MFKKRSISSAALLALLLLAVFVFPPPFVAFVIAVLLGTALWEFYVLAEIKGFRPFKAYGISAGIIYSVLCYLSSAGVFYIDADVLLVFLIITVFLKYAFKKDGSSVIAGSGVTLAGILYISYLFTFITRIRYMPDAAAGRASVTALFVITKISDISAYICGSMWGRHKLIPRISANKSIEGAVSGVISAAAAGCALRIWFLDVLSWPQVFALSVLISCAGQAGDLIESLIKRDAGVKDSGNIIPGIGGVLDLLDSLLFSAPVMYCFMAFFAG